MGVSELWSLLKSVGNVQSISASEGAHTTIVQELQGRAVAVDLSGWVVQATCQPDLAQAFNDPDSQALSVSFNRVSAGTLALILLAASLCPQSVCYLIDACPQQAVNHLRYECVPVAITEGRAPAEKLERLQQRCTTLPTWVACGREVLLTACQLDCFWASGTYERSHLMQVQGSYWT